MNKGGARTAIFGFAAMSVFAFCARGMRTSGFRKFRRQAKRKGVFFQSIYGTADLLQAFGLSFSSPAIRYTITTAAALTYIARGLSASLGLTHRGIGKRNDLVTILSSFLVVNYVGALKYDLYFLFFVIDSCVTFLCTGIVLLLACC